MFCFSPVLFFAFSFLCSSFPFSSSTRTLTFWRSHRELFLKCWPLSEHSFTFFSFQLLCVCEIITCILFSTCSNNNPVDLCLFHQPSHNRNPLDLAWAILSIHHIFNLSILFALFFFFPFSLSSSLSQSFQFPLGLNSPVLKIGLFVTSPKFPLGLNVYSFPFLSFPPKFLLGLNVSFLEFVFFFYINFHWDWVSLSLNSLSFLQPFSSRLKIVQSNLSVSYSPFGLETFFCSKLLSFNILSEHFFSFPLSSFVEIVIIFLFPFVSDEFPLGLSVISSFSLFLTAFP